jgi:hypothetical protein
MFTTSRTNVWLSVFLACGCASADRSADDLEGGFGMSRGVGLASGAVAYVGSGGFCSRPATFDFAAVRAATPEWREIQRDGVSEGSARHSLLKAALHERIVAAAQRVAKLQGYDLIVRVGDIADPRGLPIADATQQVLAAL